MATIDFEETAAGGQAFSPGAAAYACTQLGFRVFPLTPGSGTPALRSWPDVATTDEQQVRDWWSGEFGGYGVGVATGRESGIWVLDLDRKKGVDGFNTLFNLRLANDDDLSAFTRTMVVNTPSGGAHIYFRWDERAERDGGVANSTGSSNRLGPGLDVRGRGGYVRGPGWGGYQVVPRDGIRSVAIYPGPGWLVELTRKRRSEREGDAMREAHGDTSWARFNAGKALEYLGRTPEGGRNDALNLTAFRLGKLGVSTRDDAWKACQDVLIDMGAGDGMDAWLRTFNSGWNAGVATRAQP